MRGRGRMRGENNIKEEEDEAEKIIKLKRRGGITKKTVSFKKQLAYLRPH